MCVCVGGGEEKEIKSPKWSAARVSQINKLVRKGPFSVVKNSRSREFGRHLKSRRTGNIGQKFLT